MRLPAEWESQAGVLIAWPHENTDWAPRLDAVEQTCAAIAAAISRFERVIICVADMHVRGRASILLKTAGIQSDNCRFVEIEYDDTWLRDSGPITLCDSHTNQLLDFRFTGWGGKFSAIRDDCLIGSLLARDLFANAQHIRVDWALEGGAIESDGKGTILTTWRCLHQRHPEQSREAMAQILRDKLNAVRVVWLEHGYLQGDDTDAHIDTLARFAPGDTILYQGCDDSNDPHFAELARMGEELKALRTLDGKAYSIDTLPWAQPIHDDGRRLAASYANYLVINDAVLVPAYGDNADERAAQMIGRAHPGRSVISVPCRSLIWQNGSLHCMTMQLPEGSLQ